MSRPSVRPPSGGMLLKVRTFLEAIKVSHSVFALPFAVAAAFLAAGGPPAPLLLAKVILACVLARTAAMSFNRLADASLDARNPRTAGRALPAGKLSREFMGGAALLSSAGFMATAWWINTLAFYLSPVALAVLLGYSYTKRFTSLSHIVLGAALGLSPVGAWVAVRQELAFLPALLGAGVLLWTAGFDIVYACQDREFDRRSGLYSIPERIGIGPALGIARILHVAAVAVLGSAGLLEGYGLPYFLGVFSVAVLLVYQHSLVGAGDLSRVDLAFFTLNGFIGFIFMSAVILEVVL